MVDLDELDRLHMSLPELEALAVCDEFSATWRATIASADDSGDDGAVGQHERMTEASESAVAILNAWPEVSSELRERRAHTSSGELAALRALAAVVKARCDMAHPEWAPEIREALALVEKAKAP